MINYCITGKISKRLKIKPDQQKQESTGKLGNWYANYLIVARQHLVIAVSEKSLLPVLIPAKKLNDFPERVREQLGLMLQCLSVNHESIEKELSHMRDWTFSKTSNRSVIGMMVDFAKLIEYYDPYHLQEQSLLDTSLKLAHTPCSPIEYYPETEVQKIFEVNRPKIIPIKPFLKH